MEFTIDRNELAEAVTHTVHGIPNNPVPVVRAGMRIKTGDGFVSFTASDGDVTFSAVTGCQSTGDDVVTVPGKLFTDVIRSLPDQEIRFIKHDVNATLTCGRGKFTFPIYKEDYPQLLPSVVPSGFIDREVFTEAIRMVTPATSKIDTQPALCAVLLHPDGEALWLVATDRYRMASVSVPWTATGPLKPVLVPSWAAEKFTRTSGGDIIELGWSEHVATFTCGVQQLTTRLVSGTFPDWRKLRPQIPCEVEVSTGALLAALKRASLAAEQNAPVELIFTHGQLNLEAGYTNTAYDVLDAAYSGDEFRVLFGISYLTDGLAGCGDRVRFGFTASDKPVFLTSGAYSYTVLPRKPTR